VREVYERAIEATPPEDLPDSDVKVLCLRYAALERKLGEIDRARAIFVHSAVLADPRTERTFWAEWKAFEVSHGNEDTFREMLRIQRSVSASYSHMHVDTVAKLSGAGSAAAAAIAAEQQATLAGRVAKYVWQ
jgi:pre-mRNA-splicing factor SYF1